MLHLLGYDHERGPEDEAAMRARQDMIMQQLGLPRE
jgi:probable rRNA maturation factor